MSKTPETSLSNWIPKAEAAKIIGISTKQLDRYADAGKIQSGRRLNHTGHEIVVFHPGDVDRMAKQRRPETEPFVIAGSSYVPSVPVPAPITTTGETGLSRILLDMKDIVSSKSKTPDPAVRIPEKLFLTIAEAAAYSGLPKAFLSRKIADKSLPAIRTGSGWRILRQDLESLNLKGEKSL